MAEELSPESKLYVKEEIEKIRKEVKEEVEKVKSKATKTFTTVVIIVGLLTGLGVYGLAVKYIDKEIEDRISAGARDQITDYKEEAKSLRDEAKSLRDEIVGIKTNAEDKLSELKPDQRFDEVQKKLSELEPVQQKHVESIAKVEKKLSELELVQQKHVESIAKVEKKPSDLKIELKPNVYADEEGYAWIGDIALIWGTRTSTLDSAEPFFIGWDHFHNDCFTVITSLAGEVKIMEDNKRFTLNRLRGYTGRYEFTYVAIGY